MYQIYPRSFKDSTGNGLGDIYGIIEKLDYIASLGVDIIWLCPVYESPNDDNGYDISDYRKISDEFGGQEAFNLLINEVHRRSLKLVMDLVANHTSDEHWWFKKSRDSKNNSYRDYYIWKDGKHGAPPNNWLSFFGGSAWEMDEQTNQFYLHYFTKKQPDLNWKNPAVRREIYDIIRFWLDKGIDGFRMDVISLISKFEGYPDADSDNLQDTINHLYANGPKIHEYLQEMNREVLSKYDIMTVGEGPGIDLKNGPLYVDAAREELNMVFHFDHMFLDYGKGGKYDPVPINLVKFKEIFGSWDKALAENGWGSIYLGNHDFSRMVSRFGSDKEFLEASAKLLAALLLTLRGTVYIYQGDEIGMTNVEFPSIADYNDVETLKAWKEAESSGRDMEKFLQVVHTQSRDNARTPMQWNADINAGFSMGNPWLKVNPNYKKINVLSQEDNPDSILNFYREMIAFRRSNKVLVYGNYECLDIEHSTIYAYRRWDDKTEFLILHNLNDQGTTWSCDISHENYALIKTNLTEDKNDPYYLAPWQTKIFKRI